MVTQKRILELFSYCEKDASRPLVRSVDVHYNAKIGRRVGHYDGRGYLKVSIDGRVYHLHRIVFLYHNGFIPDIVDHSDGDTMNNLINNLRPASKSESCCNVGLSARNKSGVKGVSMSHGKWLSQIMVNGKRTTLYYGDDKDDAIKARVDAEFMHGEFSYTKR